VPRNGIGAPPGLVRLDLLSADSVAHVDLAAALDDLSATERPELR
jgi:hypothetical protein